MAPRGSPDSSQARFANGLCSTSMAPTPPASGFALDNRPHLQRLLQSSASPNEDSSFQIPQQVRQFYLQQRQEHAMLQNGAAVELQRAGSNAEALIGAELPKDSTQLGQALQSYVQGSLMRYHSAPSSMLASQITGMGNAIMNHSSELGHFLPGNAVSNVKDGLKSMEASLGPLHIENQVKAAASADRLPNHGNGLVPPHAPYQRVCGGGELLSQMSMDADDVALIRTPNALSEVGKAALESPSSYCPRSAFLHSSTYLENGNGTATHGMHIAKDGLLRHSSSPAGFLSQFNDDQERHILASSSGNSSEEGSYERPGGQGILGNFRWDESGNFVGGGSSNLSIAARKRIRELGEKGYSGSTVLDSQKAETLEHGVMGNYFGLPTAGSPENAYFAEKMSPDSIPCRTRAKRGCATHPRSIAERVRRTKISERMKKLQDLVPNMDKQANTAEMLDEAVEYVKFLQCQVQELTEKQSKCKCLHVKAEETTSSK